MIFSKLCCVMVCRDLSSGVCSFSALGLWLPLPRCDSWGASPGDLHDCRVWSVLVPKPGRAQRTQPGILSAQASSTATVSGDYCPLPELLPPRDSFCSPAHHITETQRALEMLQRSFLHHGWSKSTRDSVASSFCFSGPWFLQQELVCLPVRS